MQTFSPDTRKLALLLANGYCQCSEGCTKPATEFHHMCPNTKVNQKLYPLFLHSIFNCCPIFHGCHMNKPKPRISERKAGVYEKALNIIRGNNEIL